MVSKTAWPYRGQAVFFIVGWLALTLVVCLHATRIGEPLNWSDASTLSAWGRLSAAGIMPSRDAVYHTGTLPVLLDGWAQGVSGLGRLASDTLGLFANISLALALAGLLRFVGLNWLAPWLAASVLLLAPQPYHSAYIAVPLTAAILANAILDSRRLPLFVGWAVVGLAWWCRPHGAAMVGIAGAAAMVAMRGPVLVPPTRRWPLCLAALAAGLAIGAIVLHMHGILSESWRSSIIEASERKQVRVLQSVWELCSAGTAVPLSGRLLEWLWLGASAVPFLLITTLFCMSLRHSHAADRRPIAAIAALIGAGWLMAPADTIRSQNLLMWDHAAALETQRVLASAFGHYLPWWVLIGTCLACLFKPGRWQQMHCATPRGLLVIMMMMMAGGTCHLQISAVGPEYVSPPGWLLDPCLCLALVVVIGGLRWTGPPGILAAALCAAIAGRGILHETTGRSRMPGLPDGQLGSNPSTGSPKQDMLVRMRRHVQPGDTLFILGVMPSVYGELEAVNPTSLYTTYRDFSTANEVVQAAQRLISDPPQWIIVQGALPVDGGSDKMAPVIEAAVILLEQRYVLADQVIEAPEQPAYFDLLAPLRIYRRKDGPETIRPAR